MAVAELQPTAAAASAGPGGTLGPRRAPRWSAGASAVHAAVGATPGEVSAISGAAPRSLWFLGLREGVMSTPDETKPWFMKIRGVLLQ